MAFASAPARLLVHPFRAYAELARAEDAPTVVGGASRLLLVIGAVVAVTATGRLAPVELLVAALSFTYVPLIQLVALAVALRTAAKRTPLPRAFALYLAGHGPWMLALLLVAATCLVAPSPARALTVMMPPLICVALAWGILLTYACLRHGLELARARAVVATTIHVLVLTAIVVGYFVGMGQLGPLVLL